MGDVSVAPGFNLLRPSGHGLEQVFCRQLLTHAGNVKTLLGDANRKSERLALGFEPDLRNFFSPVLQGCPLFRGRLFRKVHSAPLTSENHPLRPNKSPEKIVAM